MLRERHDIGKPLLSLFLVDSDEDFERKSAACGDGVYIIEEVSEVWRPTVRRPAP
jgi:hypothetical protein